MEIFYAVQSLPKSIFLAGPTPRDANTPSWRPRALEILEEINFDGAVFVPESEKWTTKEEYLSQVEWEWEGMNGATVVVFWIPRNLEEMPAFTTNVEFGLMAHSSKVVLGYPPHTPKMGYLHALAKRYNIQVVSSLETLLAIAVETTKKPFESEVRYDIA